MITLHVIVSNTTTIKVITGGKGVWNRPKIDNVICERSLIKNSRRFYQNGIAKRQIFLSSTNWGGGATPVMPMPILEKSGVEMGKILGWKFDFCNQIRLLMKYLTHFTALILICLIFMNITRTYTSLLPNR